MSQKKYSKTKLASFKKQIKTKLDNLAYIPHVKHFRTKSKKVAQEMINGEKE